MRKVIDIPKGYKNTKVGVIPEDWNIIRLGEYAIKVGSGSTPRGGEKAYKESGIPFIRSQNVNRNRLIIDDIKYISHDIHDKMKGTIVVANDLLLNITGASIGRSCVVPNDFKEGNVNQHVCIIRLKPEISIYYVQSFLTSFIGQKSILRSQVGGNREGLNHTNVRSLKIPLPPLPEQQKIAAILSAWDSAIDNVQRIIDNLRLRNKGLARQLLTGKKRLKGFDGEWKNLRIHDIADQQKIYNKDGLDLEVLSCTKYDGLVRSLDYFGRQVFGSDLSKYKIVPNGSFAYATNHIEEGSIGYQNLLDQGLISPMYTVFKTKNGIDDNFLFRLLKTDRLIYAYQSNMSGSINRRGGLRWKDFSTIHITIPDLREQIAINKTLSRADQELQLYKQHLATLQAQKKGLMQKLLTGEIRVHPVK